MELYGVKVPKAAALLVWVALWEFIGQFELLLLFPPFSEVIMALPQVLGTPSFLEAARVTVTAYLAGLALAVVVGISLGLLMGLVRAADQVLNMWVISNNDRIPYTETLAVHAALSFRAKDNLLLEGWGEFAGGREDHNGDSLDSYFLVGGRFELSLTEQFGVYGKLVNLLNENYQLWQGYQERGFQGYVGLTFLF